MAATRTDNNSIPNSRRMWTCTNCSYAYNRMWTERCEICENLRTQPSLTQPNLITVTKTDINMTGTYHNFIISLLRETWNMLNIELVI